MNTIIKLPKPENEPILSYGVDTHERKELKEKIYELRNQVIDIPLIIGGKEIRTGKTVDITIPHEKNKVIGKYHKATSKEVELAIEESKKAKKIWNQIPWEQKVSIFLKAADILTTSYRQTLNAATMLGQSKNPFQAEIDAVCELADFFRFNSYSAQEIYSQQPSSPRGTLNYMDYRPLEGFVFAVTPFNFTSIAGNLPSAPVIMGNTSIWKPASTSVYSAYFIMKLFEKAGLPPGVINMVPGSGAEVGNPILNSNDFMGLHFTGSTAVFRGMWSTIVRNLDKYKGYPRIVGETGGKDFIFAHSSCDRQALITAIVRGSYEYQGQKCSAASRAYIPKSVWKEIKDELISQIKSLKMGPVEDFTNFINAVIDKSAFENIKNYIDYAKSSSDAKILAGGNCDSTNGYFIEPTLIETTKPDFKTIQEEIFGPVMTIYIYEDSNFEETLKMCDETSPYALTGAIFAQDRTIIMKAIDALENSAGNFYINDKPTGAVVNQQPFGGARASGTNDKAGSYLNLIRWSSPRAIKENFIPPYNYQYPFMSEK